MIKSALKAYAVTEPTEGTGGIVFAKYNIEARKHGAGEWGGGELAGMRVIRAPWADGYERGVPASLMIEHGWYFECDGCGDRIDMTYLDENELKVEDVIGMQNSNVYCNEKCQNDHIEYKRKQKEKKAEVISKLKKMVTDKFGPVSFTDQSHVYTVKRQGVWIVEQAFVTFEFDGMTLGPAKFGFPYGFGWRTIGPPKLEITVCSGDKETFEAWATRAKQALEKESGE
jgi:hypothetical protein